MMRYIYRYHSLFAQISYKLNQKKTMQQPVTKNIFSASLSSHVDFKENLKTNKKPSVFSRNSCWISSDINIPANLFLFEVQKSFSRQKLLCHSVRFLTQVRFFMNQP